MNQHATVIISKDISPPPERHEVEIAWILARHYGSVVEFLKPIDGYKMKTADILIKGVMWEIKSPNGNSRAYTIGRQFIKAAQQSRFLVIDGRRTKLPDVFIKRKIVFEMKRRSRIKKVIFITKLNEVIEF